MRFWEPGEYTERYVIKFMDVAGDSWEISIQDPTDHQEHIELTGAEYPVVWEGNGDESQDKVVLGSTGTIRIVCQPGQEDIFKYGNLLPVEINDRRVQIFRWVQRSGALEKEPVWQGFIKPSVFSQDWDASPYEISLPIVSAIAATEYFYIPEDESLFDSQQYVGGILRVILFYLGCDFYYIFSNKAKYEDLNGNEQYIDGPGYQIPAHWTQGSVSGNIFRRIRNGKMETLSFREILETLLYPFGKITEFGTDIYILMRWKNDASDDAVIKYIPVWENYEDYEFSTENRFADGARIPHISLNEIVTGSTNNTFSHIPAPSIITSSANVDGDETIFGLNEKMIKPSLPSDTYEGRSNVSFASIGDQSSPVRRGLYAISRHYITQDAFMDIDVSNDEYASIADYAFCRVAEATGPDNTNVDYSLRVPLALCFNLNLLLKPGIAQGSRVAFTLRNPVRTIQDINFIKLELEIFSFTEKDPTTNPGGFIFSMKIQDLYTGRFLQGDKTWGNETSIGLGSMETESNKKILRFNEDKILNDKTPHSLRLTFIGFPQSMPFATDQLMYGRFYVIPSIKYETTKTLYDDVIWQYLVGGVGINNYKDIIGGPGNELTIDFKTMCGMKNRQKQGSTILPYNSFNDNINRIDRDNRKMIEINDAEYQEYQGYRNMDFLRTYMVVKDGQDVFIPVAIGMNPRMRTLRLKLVSTNVQ